MQFSRPSGEWMLSVGRHNHQLRVLGKDTKGGKLDHFKHSRLSVSYCRHGTGIQDPACSPALLH